LNSLAVSSSKKAETAFRSWQLFCRQSRLPESIFTEEAFLLFAAWHFRKGNKPSTVKAYISAIVSVKKRIGYDINVRNMLMFERCMAGYKRLTKHNLKLRRPITVAILKKLHSHVRPANPNEAVAWAVMVLAVFGLLRLGEIAQAAKSSYYPKVGMFAFDPMDRTHLRYHLPGSKNDPWRLGATIHYTASGSAVCPIDVTKSLAHTWAASDPSAPAFPDANGRPMSKRTVLTVLENLLKRAGLSDTDQFSGHSFRKGGAQSLYDAGVPLADIKTLGRWRSWCFTLYFRITLEKHHHYSRSMAGAAPSTDLYFGRAFAF
jgi:integrase